MWPLVYNMKGEATKSMKADFIDDVDYQHSNTKVERLGIRLLTKRPKTLRMVLIMSCSAKMRTKMVGVSLFAANNLVMLRLARLQSG